MKIEFLIGKAGLTNCKKFSALQNYKLISLVAKFDVPGEY